MESIFHWPKFNPYIYWTKLLECVVVNLLKTLATYLDEVLRSITAPLPRKCLFRPTTLIVRFLLFGVLKLPLFRIIPSRYQSSAARFVVTQVRLANIIY